MYLVQYYQCLQETACCFYGNVNYEAIFEEQFFPVLSTFLIPSDPQSRARKELQPQCAILSLDITNGFSISTLQMLYPPQFRSSNHGSTTVIKSQLSEMFITNVIYSTEHKVSYVIVTNTEL